MTEEQEQLAPVDPHTIGELISLAEAAKLSGFAHDNLKRVAQSGKLHAKKIGRNWVTTLAAVEEYRENRSFKNIPKKYREKA
jgi:5'-3' exonuclease